MADENNDHNPSALDLPAAAADQVTEPTDPATDETLVVPHVEDDAADIAADAAADELAEGQAATEDAAAAADDAAAAAVVILLAQLRGLDLLGEVIGMVL